MYEKSCVIMNGEILGNGVIANRYFIDIYNISPIIIKNFIAIINATDKVVKPVRIKRFDIEKCNYINIYFKNKNSAGNVMLSYILNKNNELELERYLFNITTGDNSGYCICGIELPPKKPKFVDYNLYISQNSFCETFEKLLDPNISTTSIDIKQENYSKSLHYMATADTIEEHDKLNDNLLNINEEQDMQNNCSIKNNDNKIVQEEDNIKIIDSKDTEDNNLLQELENTQPVDIEEIDKSPFNNSNNTEKFKALNIHCYTRDFDIRDSDDKKTSLLFSNNTEGAPLKSIDEQIFPIPEEQVAKEVEPSQKNNNEPQVQNGNDTSIMTEINEKKQNLCLNVAKNEACECEEIQNPKYMIGESQINTINEELNENLFNNEIFQYSNNDIVDFFDTIPRFVAESIDYEFFNLDLLDNTILNKNKITNNSKSNLQNYKDNSLDLDTKISMYQKNFVGYDKQMAALKIDKLKQNIKQLQKDPNLTNDDILDAQIELLLNDKAKAFKILDSNNKNDVLQLDNDLFLSKDKVYRWGDILVLEE